MNSITNSIVNSVYSDNGPTKHDPKRTKHAQAKAVPAVDGLYRKVAQQETKKERDALINENERLHRMQAGRRNG